MRTITATSGHRLEFLEQFDFLFIITDLHVLVIDDNGPFEHRRILDNEVAELIQRHRFDIYSVFLNDLGSLGDDVVGTVFSPGYEVFNLLLVEKRIENILLNERKMVVLKIILYFSA